MDIQNFKSTDTEKHLSLIQKENQPEPTQQSSPEKQFSTRYLKLKLMENWIDT